MVHPLAQRSSIGLLAPVFLLLFASGCADAQPPSASATTEHFLWLHKRLEAEPSRWRIFSMSAPGPRASTQPSVGMGVSYNW